MGANYVDLESGYKTSVDTYFDESRQNLLSSYNQYKTEAEQAYNENKKALEDLYTPLKTNYDNLIQNYQNLYTPMANQYRSEQSIYKTQANYDISQAYANYKKQQLNLLQTQRLGTGFKENVGSILKTNYSNLFSGIKKEEAQNLADLEQAYLKKVASNAETIYGLQEDYEKKKASIDTDIESLATAYNKDLENKEKAYQTELSTINKESADYAKKQYKVTKNLFNFAIENNEAVLDAYRAEKKYDDLTNEDVFLKWMADRGYLTSTVNTDTMSEDWELTPYGVDYLAQQVFNTNTKGETFNDWLARTDEDAYKFYNEKDETGALRNQTIQKDLLGLYEEKDGQRIYDMSYNKEQGLNRRLQTQKYKENTINEEAPGYNYKSNSFLQSTDIQHHLNYVKNDMTNEYKAYIEKLGLNWYDYSTEINKFVSSMTEELEEQNTAWERLQFWRRDFSEPSEIGARIQNEITKLNEEIKQDALDPTWRDRKKAEEKVEAEKKAKEEAEKKAKEEAEKKAKEEAERNKNWNDRHFEQSQEMLRKQGNDALADYFAEQRSKFDSLKPKTFR